MKTYLKEKIAYIAAECSELESYYNVELARYIKVINKKYLLGFFKYLSEQRSKKHMKTEHIESFL